MPGQCCLNGNFRRVYGKKLTVTSLFQTIKDRDNMLKSGTEKEQAESMERFSTLL
jgi:hypothetical protein